MHLKTAVPLLLLLAATTTVAAAPAPRAPLTIHHPLRVGHPQRTGITPAAADEIGYIPCDVAHAYSLGAGGLTGSGKVIAIVDAFDTPTMQSDVNTFDSTFALPSLTVDIRAPFGGPNPAPDPNDLAGWRIESSLDVEWAHAVAPGAQVVLVQAATDLLDNPSAPGTRLPGDLMAAVSFAVGGSVDADVVSMSWGAPEAAWAAHFGNGFESSFNALFPATNAVGRPVTYLASTGDFGFETDFPAVSSNVLGVGGTSLTPAAFGYAATPGAHHDCSGAGATFGVNQSNETVWGGSVCFPPPQDFCEGTSGGPSAFESVPGWQAGFAPGAHRSAPDVAALADPASGVAVFTGGAWFNGSIGGTSLSAPLWAGVTALLDQGRGSHSLPGLDVSGHSGWPEATSGRDFNDIVTGSSPAFIGDPCVSDGSCVARPGYDQVTGRGSPLFASMAADLVTGSVPRGNLTTVAPTRIMDTRDGTGGVPHAPMVNGQVIPLTITGPAASAAAIVVNVGVTDTVGMPSGFVLVYPCGQPRPVASTVNFKGGQTIAILSQVQISGGCLNVFLDTAGGTGSADVFLDLQGFFSGSPSGATGLYNPLSTPVRALDTRTATGGHNRPFGPGESFPLTVAGSFGIPADAAAVVLNLTAVNGSASSYLSAYPASAGGTTCPPALTFSNLNLAPARVIANRVTVKVGDAGRICFYNSQGQVDVLADLAGWYSGGQVGDTTGLLFSPFSPTRIFDSRPAGLLGPGVGTCPGANFDLPVVPAASAVSFNLTGLDASASTFLSAFPTGHAPSPPTSDLNYLPGDVQPNLVITRVGDAHSITICNSAGSTDFFVDVSGIYV